MLAHLAAKIATTRRPAGFMPTGTSPACLASDAIESTPTHAQRNHGPTRPADSNRAQRRWTPVVSGSNSATQRPARRNSSAGAREHPGRIAAEADIPVSQQNGVPATCRGQWLEDVAMQGQRATAPCKRNGCQGLINAKGWHPAP